MQFLKGERDPSEKSAVPFGSAGILQRAARGAAMVASQKAAQPTMKIRKASCAASYQARSFKDYEAKNSQNALNAQKALESQSA